MVVQKFLITGFLLITVFLVSGCLEKETSVAKNQEEINRISEEMLSLKGDIKETEIELSSQTKRNLASQFKEVRLEILRTSYALLSKRRYALRYGATFEFVEPATKPDPQRALELATEIKSVEEDLTNQPQAKGRGLVGALAAFEVQTKKMALSVDISVLVLVL